MKDLISLFQATCIATLLLANVVIGGARDTREFTLFLILYVVVTVWRNKIYARCDLLADIRLDRLKARRPSIFLFGNLTESLEAEKRETQERFDTWQERFWESPLFIYALLACGSGYFLATRFEAKPLGTGFCAAVVFGFFLIRSNHLCHYLLPLFLSALSVVVNIWFSGHEISYLVFVYFFGFIFSLVVFQKLRLLAVSEKPSTTERLSRSLAYAGQVTLGFMMCLYLGAKIFPERKISDHSNQRDSSSISEGKKRVAHDIAKSLTTVEEKVRGQTPTLPSSTEESRPKAGSQGLPENFKDMSEQIGKMDPKKRLELVDQFAKQGSQGKEEAGPRTDTSAENANGMSGGGGKGDAGSGTQNAGGTDAGKEPIVGPANSKSDQPQKTAKERDRRIKDIEVKIEKIFDNIERYLGAIILAAVVLGVLYKLHQINQVKKKQREHVLTRAQKAGLAAEIRRIRQTALSPDHEVIETYNVILKVFSSVAIDREESTPARLFAEAVTKKIPKLKTSLIDATHRFDRTLYGESVPTAPELVEFRKASGAIFHQFDL